MRRAPNKTKLILTILAAGLMLLMWSATTALAGGGDSPDDAPPGDKYPDDSVYKTTYQSHMLVVKMYPQFSASDVNAVLNVENIEQSLLHSNTYLVEISSDADPETTATSLAGQSGIAYAHPNYILNALHPVQGSIPFSDEVHIGSFEGQQAVTMTNLVAAHTDATGDQITVGVIDGGVDFAHPALDGKAVSGWDYIDMDNDAYDEPGGDASGHGTFVAGLVHLVAPDATIRAYRVMDEDGGGDGFSLALAIERAVDDGCDVINLSVVLTNQHLAVQDAINYAASKGVIVVAAAGNDADDVPVYPAAESNAIAVAALDSLLHAADFTNFGSYIDVCAPGVGTYSAYQGDLYAWWNGTSFAAPFVAGEAALLRQDYPTLLAAQIKGKILASSQSVDPTNPDMIGKLGNGLIDPSAALEVSADPDTAMIIPDVMLFTHIEGASYFKVPEQSALLLSSNAPADYSIQLIETADTFINYYSGTGQTNDSIYVSFDAGDLPAGDYYNILEFYVDGVRSTAMLVVQLKVIPEPPVETEAHFTQSQIFFTAQSETDPLLYGAGFLTSSNAPAAFTAEESGYINFITLQTFSGTTDDSVYFSVDPGKVPGPGLYIDTILCWVDGVTDPAKLLVQLTVDGGNPAPDSLTIYPLSQSFEMICYTLDTLVGQIAILYDGDPHRWVAVYDDPPEFLTVTDSVGYTSDSVRFVISAGSLPPGDYTDRLLIYVEGLTASPVTAEINLHVQDSSGGLPPVYLSPPSLSFTAVVGSIEPMYGSTRIYIPLLNPPPFPTWYGGIGTFSQLWNSTGTTLDSILVEVHPRGLTVGSYTDTISIHVEGFSQPVKLPVHLEIVSAGAPELLLFPPGPIYLVTDNSTNYSATMFAVLYESEGAELAYTGEVKGGGQFTELLTTSGVTPDTVYFTLDQTGFDVGEYVDTILFTVESYAEPVVLETRMLVNQADTTVYPPYPIALSTRDLYFTVDEGSTEPLTGCAYLWNLDSVEAPYTAGYYYGGEPWMEILSLSGTTPDSVCIQVDPTGLTAGTYYDAAAFGVVGYEFPAILDVHLTVVDPDDTTYVPGDTTNPLQPKVFFFLPFKSFYVDEGSTDVITGGGFIYATDSSVSPFTGYVQPGSHFTELLTTSGMTFDSIYYEVDPTGLSAGVYYDSVYFDVEGFEKPALLTLRMTVNPQDTVVQPTDSIVVFPFGPVYLVCEEGYTTPANMFKAIWISDDAELPYTALVKNGGQFTELLTTSGVTPDTIRFTLDATGFEVGEYVDTIEITVDNHPEPVMFETRLIVNPTDTVVVPVDSLVMEPRDLYFTIDEGSTELLTGCAVLWNSDGAPLPYTSGYYYGGPSFFDIMNPSGVTPDTVCIQIDPTGMTAGSYYDAAAFTVEGYDYPALLNIHLTIGNPGDTTGPGDTTQYPPYATVLPPQLDFIVDEGATDPTSACAYLWCSDSVPAPFIGYAQSGARFTDLLTLSGYTFDSVCVEVDPTGFSAGTYYDSVYFDIEGVQDSVMLTVRLMVNGGSDTLNPISGTLSQNYPNPFNPTTTISFDLNIEAHVTLDVYNVLGRKVTTLVNDNLAAGEHSVQWDASSAASGIYFYRLNIGGEVETRKMVLLR